MNTTTEYLESLRVALRSDPELLGLSEPPADIVEAYAQGEDRERMISLGQIALYSLQIEALESIREEKVRLAREQGWSSWNHIGSAVGITSQAAHKRWNPDARAKAAKYMREYSAKRRD